MAHTDQIAHRLAGYLHPFLPHFRYVRSRTQLVHTEGAFSDDIIISVITYDRLSYSISFSLGVQHSQIASLVTNVEGRAVTPDDRTIFQFSPNVGKQSSLPFAGPTCWSGLPATTDFSLVGSEIVDFINGFALPYHQRFHNLDEMRNSLVLRDGLSLNHHPFKEVLAIDAFLSDSNHVISYLQLLQREVQSGYHHDCDVFNAYYARMSPLFPEIFPSFRLTPKPSASNRGG